MFTYDELKKKNVLTQKGKTMFVITALCVFYAAVMVVAGLYDLDINKKFYDKPNAFWQFISDIGQYPSWLVVPYWAAVGIIALLIKYKKINAPYFNRLLEIGIYFAIFVAVSGISVQVVKMLWGRTRFASMVGLNGGQGDFTAFSPWYIPQGITNNRSFFSGHTIMAEGIYVLFYWFATSDKLKKYKYYILVFCTLAVAMVAASRIILGAHFLSDVTMGAFVGNAVLYGTDKLMKKRINPYLYGQKGEQMVLKLKGVSNDKDIAKAA